MAGRLKRRPIIGVTTSRGRGRVLWWFNKLALMLAGSRPVRLTPDDAPVDVSRYDGFVLGGGDDVSADLYQGTLGLSIRIDPERDAMEQGVLSRAEIDELPVLGVCRGAQMINVYFGGSLFQDTYAEHGGKRRRTAFPCKRVRIAPSSRLHAITGTINLRVNSLHRQSVKRLGNGLSAVACDEFGIVQAIENAERPFLLGVQWHPEILFLLPRHLRLFKALTRAARTQVRERAARRLA